MMFGVVGAFILSRSKFDFWFKHSFKIHIAFTFLLALCFFPSLALQIKGATRWIRVGGFTVQPGEFVKYSTLFCSVSFFGYFSRWDARERYIRFGILIFPMLLLMLQPDFGMFFLCAMNIILVSFFSDFPRKWFYSSFLVSLALMGGLLIMAPYRVKRLVSYLDPWNDPMDSGFQVIQSFLAFALGGVWGAGIGNSKEKLFYLPEAHNDFIFSVIGEELGFAGTLLLISLFFLFLIWGVRLALGAKGKFKPVFAIVAIVSITLQAIINMGVVLGLLPTKGLNLPFISYGGSSLLANALLLGLFFSVVLQNESEPPRTTEPA